jgi:hypothetical protein
MRRAMVLDRFSYKKAQSWQATNAAMLPILDVSLAITTFDSTAAKRVCTVEL